MLEVSCELEAKWLAASIHLINMLSIRWDLFLHEALPLIAVVMLAVY